MVTFSHNAARRPSLSAHASTQIQKFSNAKQHIPNAQTYVKNTSSWASNFRDSEGNKNKDGVTGFRQNREAAQSSIQFARGWIQSAINDENGAIPNEFARKAITSLDSADTSIEEARGKTQQFYDTVVKTTTDRSQDESWIKSIQTPLTQADNHLQNATRHLDTLVDGIQGGTIIAMKKETPQEENQQV